MKSALLAFGALIVAAPASAQSARDPLAPSPSRPQPLRNQLTRLPSRPGRPKRPCTC